MKPYYEDSFCTIYHGDCREILPQLPKVDLVLTDPPYGTQGLGGGYGRRQLHSIDGRLGRTIKNDEDLSIVMEVAPSLYRLLNDDGWCMAFCAARRMVEVAQIFQLSRFQYFGEVIWDKGAPGLGYSIRYSHENALVFKKGDPETPDSALFSIIRETISHQDSHNKHPHEKPVRLWRSAIGLGGETILDPFCGSGSVLVAAKQMGKKAVGIEAEEQWCEAAAKRLQQEYLPLTTPSNTPCATERELW
jgi:adenine-specific DNA-methyltransferase